MNRKRRFLIVILLAGIALAGCAAQTPPAPQVPPLTAPAPSEEETGPTGEEATSSEEKTAPSEKGYAPSEEGAVPSETPKAGPPPHVVASLQLTDQGRLLLEKGQTDDAIRILERAVNLNPAHGQNYYYLAEAWIRKRNPSQAKEFNRLAGLYLHEDKAWLSRVKAQRARIEEE